MNIPFYKFPLYNCKDSFPKSVIDGIDEVLVYPNSIVPSQAHIEGLPYLTESTCSFWSQCLPVVLMMESTTTCC